MNNWGKMYKYFYAREIIQEHMSILEGTVLLHFNRELFKK